MKEGLPPHARRPDHKRIEREQRTVQVMISMYCEDHHPRPAEGTLAAATAEPRLCPDCGALLTYAQQRVERCRFGQGKPTCARCRVHCFAPSMRERIRAVMRYSGPRMILHHPYLALQHLLDAQGDSKHRSAQ